MLRVVFFMTMYLDNTKAQKTIKMGDLHSYNCRSPVSLLCNENFNTTKFSSAYGTTS